MEENFKTAAARLGLLTKPHEGLFSGIHIYGQLGGYVVDCAADRDFIHAGVSIETDNVFGLSVATSGVLGRLAHLFTGDHSDLGDPEFDKAFRVKAHDPKILPALLTPPLRARLLDVAKRDWHPSINDKAVLLYGWPGFPGPLLATPEYIETGLQEAVAIAALFHEAVRAQATSKAP